MSIRLQWASQQTGRKNCFGGEAGCHRRGDEEIGILFVVIDDETAKEPRERAFLLWLLGCFEIMSFIAIAVLIEQDGSPGRSSGTTASRNSGKPHGSTQK